MKSKNAELIFAMIICLFMGLSLIGSFVDFYYTQRPPFAFDSNDLMLIGAKNYQLKMMNGALFWAGIIFWLVAFLIWSYRRKTRISGNDP